MIEPDPLFVADAARFKDGHWHIPMRNGLRSLREQPGFLVEGFMPGWRPDCLCNAVACYPLLQLRSEDEYAVRILNTEARCLGDRLQHMPAADAARFRKQVLHLLRPLFLSLLGDARPLLSEAQAAFLRLHPSVSFALASTVREELVADPMTVAARDLPAVLTVNSTIDGRPVPIEPMRIEQGLALDFQLQIATAPGGILHWPSPVDGAPVPAQGSICFSDMAIAYRFHDARHGCIFFLLTSDEYARPIGMYLGTLDLLVPRSPDLVAWAARTMASNVSASMIHAVCHHGADLIATLNRGARRTVNLMRSPPWTHMAHQLWNELSGMAFFLEHTATGTPIPQTIAPCGGVGMELYGPVDALLPEWRGHVMRGLADAQAAMTHSYRSDSCVVRLTRDFVSEGLRARLRRHAMATCDCNDALREIEVMRDKAGGRARSGSVAPVIMIGLRVENRTHADLGGLLLRLLERVAAEYPGAIAIIDGHNTRVGDDGTMIPGDMIISHGEALARERPVEVERRLAGNLRLHLASRDIRILDTIGCSMSDSMALSIASDCFFAVWGACLAKFRWVANKPGVALTSRDNLLHRPDLLIYHSPNHMESPTEMILPDPAWVEDLPDAPLLSNPGPGQARFCNFRIEEARVFDAMLGLIARSLKQPAEDVMIA